MKTAQRVSVLVASVLGTVAILTLWFFGIVSSPLFEVWFFAFVLAAIFAV